MSTGTPPIPSRWPSQDALAALLPSQDGVLLRGLAEAEIDAFVADLGRWYPALVYTSEAQMLNASFFRQHRATLLVIVAWAEGVRCGVTMLELDVEQGGLLGRFCAVDPTYRGRRLASLFVEAQVAVARAIGASHTHAQTELNNRAPGKAFLGHDFQPVALLPAAETKLIDGNLRYVPEVVFFRCLRTAPMAGPPPPGLYPPVESLWRRITGEEGAFVPPQAAACSDLPPVTGCWPTDLPAAASWLQSGQDLPATVADWSPWARTVSVPSLSNWLAACEITEGIEETGQPAARTLLWWKDGALVGILGLSRDPSGERLTVSVAATAAGHEDVARQMLSLLGPVAATLGLRQVWLRLGLGDVARQELAEAAGLAVVGILPKKAEMEVLHILSLLPASACAVPSMETMLPSVARVVEGRLI